MERYRVTITVDNNERFEYFEDEDPSARPCDPGERALRKWRERQPDGSWRVLVDVEVVPIDRRGRTRRRPDGGSEPATTFTREVRRCQNGMLVMSDPWTNLAELMFPGKIHYPAAIQSIGITRRADGWSWTISDSEGEWTGDLEGTTPRSKVDLAQRRMAIFLMKSRRHELQWPWTQVGDHRWEARAE